MSPSDPLIKYDDSTLSKMQECNRNLSQVVRAFYICSRQVMSGNAEIPAAKARDSLNAAIDQVYELSVVGLEVITKDMSDCLKIITDLNKSLQNGEWDSNELKVDNSGPSPVFIRCQVFKDEIKEAEMMKYKLENKDLDIKELKKTLKMKSEEMSELQVRKDKAEKRLSDATKEAELMREKMQRKLDDAQETLKAKEKEFEDTMDHLQKDLDNLESERGELKNKLKETTMKQLLENIARGSPASNTSSMAPMSMGPSIPAPVKDSPLLTRQVQDLQLALAALREESYRYLFITFY